MELLDTMLLYGHIVSGAVSLLTGYAIFFFKKGGKTHKSLGKVYVWAMVLSFVTAMSIMLIFRLNPFLFVIAVFSFYLSVVGYRIVKGRKREKPNAGDWFFTFLITLAALAFFVTSAFFFYKNIVVPGGLLAFFGVVATFLARNNWRIALDKYPEDKEQDKKWWIRYHIQGMIASMIAATTAFLVNVGPQIVGPWKLSWIFWVLPTLVGTFIIIHWSRKYNPQKK